MFHHKNISLKYWAEAINTTIYLKARCLYKIVEGMMLEEAWSRKKPTTNHLRIFGCEAYTLILNKMRTKVEAKSVKYMFVGYSDGVNAYQLIDSTMGKFKVNHDVVFNKANISCSKLDTTLTLISRHELGRNNGAMVDHELD